MPRIASIVPTVATPEPFKKSRRDRWLENLGGGQVKVVISGSAYTALGDFSEDCAPAFEVQSFIGDPNT